MKKRTAGEKRHRVEGAEAREGEGGMKSDFEMAEAEIARESSALSVAQIRAFGNLKREPPG